MLCQICNKDTATIHLTEITDNKRQETHLCEICAQKQGIAVKSQLPLNELLSTLLSIQPESIDSDSSSSGQIETPCPVCGITLRQFSEQSLLGCPYDYEFFEKQLSPVISKVQNSRTGHRGKIPSRLPADHRGAIELFELNRQLETALSQEDYEAAAHLRDKINKLK